MSILFLARKLASDCGFIEQIQQSHNRNQINYRFYSPRTDLHGSNTNRLYGSPGKGVISQNTIFIYCTEMEKTVILLNVQIDYLKRNLKCCINCSWIINTLWKRYSRHPIIDFSLFRHAIPKHYFTKERHKIRNKLSACLTQAQNIHI